jgi:hypothetical protein
MPPNEAVIPLGQKDTFNAPLPKNDMQFAGAGSSPTVKLMPVLYGSAIPDAAGVRRRPRSGWSRTPRSSSPDCPG